MFVMMANSQQVHITVTLFCFTHFSVHREISIQSLGNKGRIKKQRWGAGISETTARVGERGGEGFTKFFILNGKCVYCVKIVSDQNNLCFFNGFRYHLTRSYFSKIHNLQDSNKKIWQLRLGAEFLDILQILLKV